MAKETKTASAPAPYDWSQSGVTGFENTSQTDLGIPFLAILQDGSPQVKKSDSNYALKKIEGATPGDVINNIANTVLYKQGGAPLRFIPCSHERLYVEWKPRNTGGGMVKVHANANVVLECTRNERNQDMLKNGNIIVTTSYFYGLLIRADEDALPCVIGLSSTQLKKSRLWLNMMTALKLTGPDGKKFTPPMFSHSYALTTIPETNNDGSWFGWQIRMDGPITDRVLIERSISTAKTSFTGRAALPAPAQEESPESY